MQLPNEILEKAIEIAEKFSKKQLSQSFKEVSNKYCAEKNGYSLLNQEEEAAAYSLSRMPATYGAVYNAFFQTLDTIERQVKLKTLLDVGAGTGAATLAIANQININKIICLEREDAMLNLGKILLEASDKKEIRDAIWIKQDLMKDSIMETIKEKADIIVVSYMLNELDETNRLKLVENLWNQTNQILLIVDPGTPKDFKNMMQIKRFLVNKGARVIAPCANERECSLPSNDWCHFLCRVERTKWQKDIKMATVPYEDEKFTYLAFSKEDIGRTKNRVIRPSINKTNFIQVKLCEENKVSEKIYTRKDKEMYKKAKKIKVGETF